MCTVKYLFYCPMCTTSVVMTKRKLIHECNKYGL